EVLPEERARPLQECVERTLETGTVQSIEYQLEIGGELRDFEARMVPSGSDEVVAIVREFTERKRLQRELQQRVCEIEREQEFARKVVDTAPGIFVTIDPEGRITRFNTTTERLFGYPADDSMQGHPYWDVFLPEPGQREQALRILERLRAGEPIVEHETTWHGLDGRRAVIFASYTPIRDGRGEQRYLICGLDMTERVRELEELRELARGLHPAILSDRGLGPALESLAGRAAVPVELEPVPEDRLPGPVEAAAFYVVSESLANVAKYAEASHARVRVARENGHAVVEVSDDGVGGADPARGSGLRGLLDRVEALDGTLELASRPGSGTSVRAVIPLAMP